MRLLADHEVVTVTAGRQAETEAVAALQQAQEQLAAVEKVRRGRKEHYNANLILLLLLSHDIKSMRV
jgi:hypothetical protein